MKHLLFYPGTSTEGGRHLQNLLQRAAPDEETEICQSIHVLAYKLLPLRTIDNHVRLTPVLVTTCMQDLLALHSISDLLSDLRFILIVHNRDPETVAQAHALFPRYLGYLDEDFAGVAEVFAKMVHNGNDSGLAPAFMMEKTLSP